jgi:predicted transcriptional regulator
MNIKDNNIVRIKIMHMLKILKNLGKLKYPAILPDFLPVFSQDTSFKFISNILLRKQFPLKRKALNIPFLFL